MAFEMEAMKLILLFAIMCVSDADDWEITVSMSPIEATTICTDLSVTFYEREDDGSSSPAPNVTMEITMPSVCNAYIPNIDRPMKIDVWNDGNADAVNYLFEKLTMRSSSFHLTFECNCYLSDDGSKQTLYPNDDQWEIQIGSGAGWYVGQYNYFAILVHDISGISQQVDSRFKRGQTTTIEERLHIEEPLNYTTVRLTGELHANCIAITLMHISTCRTFGFKCWKNGWIDRTIQGQVEGIIDTCFPTTTTTAAIPPICVCNPTTTPPMTSIHTTYPTTSEGFTTTTTSESTTTTTTYVTTAVSTTKPATTTISTTTSTTAALSTTTPTSTATTMTPSGSSQNVATITSATESTDTPDTDTLPVTDLAMTTESGTLGMSTATTWTSQQTTNVQLNVTDQILTRENNRLYAIIEVLTAHSNLSCCECFTRKQLIINLTNSELQMLLLQLKQQLTVNKSSLSSTIRKKTCAEDNRPTSKAMGMIGAVLLAIPFILMISCDLSTIFGSRGQL